MKKIKMKTILANSEITANIDDVITVDDNFAEKLVKANACEIIEDLTAVEVVEEVTMKAVEEKTKESKKATDKKRR